LWLFLRDLFLLGLLYILIVIKTYLGWVVLLLFTAGAGNCAPAKSYQYFRI